MVQVGAQGSVGISRFFISSASGLAPWACHSLVNINEWFYHLRFLTVRLCVCVFMPTSVPLSGYFVFSFLQMSWGDKLLSINGQTKDPFETVPD